MLRILQSSSITGTSPSDCLVSYPGHSFRVILPLCRSAVGVFFSPSRQGNSVFTSHLFQYSLLFYFNIHSHFLHCNIYSLFLQFNIYIHFTILIFIHFNSISVFLHMLSSQYLSISPSFQYSYSPYCKIGKKGSASLPLSQTVMKKWLLPLPAFYSSQGQITHSYNPPYKGR